MTDLTPEQMAARIAELEGEKTKLQTKNSELIGREKEQRDRAIAAETAREEAAERAEREAKDVEALEKRLTAKFQKDIDRLTGERDAATTQLRTTLVDNEIAKAIRDNNVREGMDEALTALFTQKVKFENGEASIDGKSIGEFAGEYLGSAVGAIFRRASDHSGTDAPGNTTKTVHAKLTKRPSTNAEWDILDAMPAQERNAFADSINAPDLKV